MPTSKEYISEYGNLTFEERPFSDADAIALCEVIYMPLEKVVSERFTDEPVAFTKAAADVFAYRNNKHTNLGLMITNAPSLNIEAMSKTKRFSELKIVAVKEVYSVVPACQFCAGTFILPDGTLVVTFRGTNDDIAGWKEDLDMFSKSGIPSHSIALEYINNVAANFDGEIIVIGHSKGGHLSLYSALMCDEKVRDRIKYVYNNDGPGFYNYDYYKTGSYEEILPKYKHYIPSSSFIGVLLAHDYDYKAVKSSKHLGPLQHDMGTWQIENGELSLVDDTDNLSKITDLWLAQLFSGLGEKEKIEVLGKVMEDICIGFGQRTLLELAKNLPSSVGGAVKAWKASDKADKADFKGAFSGAGKMLKNSIKAVKGGCDVKEMVTACFEKLK